ncbi:NADPH-dependent ferric siderophore reductase [Actinomadura pelletieri DSM 43383]|uniref:NADPH-dependent ferric siderophore reductase n=1 Tax=Actinomadura pelletieri DSM 43383 TaxID=1120940 RepID=A0A495QU09_9ACTN|nr:siderophore-interacting protein [Actinomadura pelletieri]RKS77004.1 NADPH-dependent ferric siderophore reductase [Actinomadura pelletieri DSM 43383]
MATTDRLVRIVEHPITPRLTEVKRVRRLTPRMVRVTLGGECLDGFCEQAPADHVKLYFAQGDDPMPVTPYIRVGYGLDDPPEGTPQAVMRDYTVRHYRPDERELDIDMVIHGDGPGSSFAAAARPGDLVGVLGPRGSEVVPYVFDWYLLGCDETGLPALARWLEALPAGARAFAYCEVADAAEEQELRSDADVTVTWVHRDGVPPGRSDALEKAVRAFSPPAGDGFAWFGAEATTLKPIRRYLRNEVGMPKERVDVDGYWKVGAADHNHHDGLD